MGTQKIKKIGVSSTYKYPSKLAKRLLVFVFRKSIHTGTLRLQFADETINVGNGNLVCTIAPPSLARFFWMMLRPDFRLPLHYTKGYWCCEEGKLYEFLELLTAQSQSPLHWWFKLFSRSPVRDGLVYRLFPIKVKENIAAHYNTSPEFMRLIIGEKLEYTCAFFEDNFTTLEAAQENKINIVVERLGLSNKHKVLDLGCGWGQIAAAISEKTGAHVVGLNITPNQINYAQSRSGALTKFYLTDYEAFQPEFKFDHLYSIGMLEHVGRGNLKNYFRQIRNILKPNGLALVHCIVRKEKGATNSWIDEEVFPGAYIPELAEVIAEIETSGLELKTIFTHDKSNYFKTLNAWLNNFRKNEKDLKDIMLKSAGKKDADQIMKIWEFYLCGSRLVFNDPIGYCYNVQIVMRQPPARL